MILIFAIVLINLVEIIFKFKMIDHVIFNYLALSQ